MKVSKTSLVALALITTSVFAYASQWSTPKDNQKVTDVYDYIKKSGQLRNVSNITFKSVKESVEGDTTTYKVELVSKKEATFVEDIKYPASTTCSNVLVKNASGKYSVVEWKNNSCS